MTQPFFSVIIVNYNGGAYLQGAIDSLTRQSFSDFEVFVVDNASTDGSMDGLDTAHSKQPVHLMPQSRNTGFAEGNNIAARQANGQWIALLNADAEADPDWLLTLHSAIDMYPNYRMIASLQVRMDDPEQLDGAGDGYSAYGFAWRGGYLKPRSSTPKRGETFGPCGASAAYETAAFLEHGGFDESYFCYMEDVDLAFRMRLAGEKCLFLPEAIVTHKGGGLSGEKSEFSVVHGTRNRVWTYLGNMPSALFWLTLPMHLALTSYLALWYAFRPYGRYVRKGLMQGWSKAWDVRRNRKVLRVERIASVGDLINSMTWNPIKMSRHKPDVRPFGDIPSLKDT